MVTTLLLDIGGTFIKYGLSDESGKLLSDSIGQVPSEADSSYDHFLQVLSEVISWNQQKQNFITAGVAIPGPFNYDQGISLMKHKFRALYQKPISSPFANAGVKVTFLHDSTAFILGEVEPEDGEIPGGIMLGTGLGFAMMRKKRVCLNPAQMPAFSLWKMPWKDGIAEDYVSQHALIRRYGSEIPVKEIAKAARAGDKKAQQTFLAVGAELNEILCKIISALGLNSIILGGQISQSADLLELDLPVPLRVSAYPEKSALKGIGRYMVQGKETCVEIMNCIEL